MRLMASIGAILMPTIGLADMNCVDAEEVFRESLSESFFSDEFYTEMELLEPVGEPLTGEQLLADPEHRWRMVTSLYIGDTIWIVAVWHSAQRPSEPTAPDV